MSTLRSCIEAMGSRLELVATFPDRDPVRITGFEELGEEDPGDEAKA